MRKLRLQEVNCLARGQDTGAQAWSVCSASAPMTHSPTGCRHAETGKSTEGQWSRVCVHPWGVCRWGRCLPPWLLLWKAKVLDNPQPDSRPYRSLSWAWSPWKLVYCPCGCLKKELSVLSQSFRPSEGRLKLPSTSTCCPGPGGAGELRWPSTCLTWAGVSSVLGRLRGWPAGSLTVRGASRPP